MPVVKTKGSASSQGFGEFAQANAQANWIDDVFSTYLWTTTGSQVTIENGIDLATKGGLVWDKCRSVSIDNMLTDTARGVNKYLVTNSTSAEQTGSGVQSFNTNGFTTGSYTSGRSYASWTFAKQAKFFDVVTYTGNGGSGALKVNHSLGVTPAFVIIKNTSNTSNWAVCARNSSGNYEQLYLNTTAASLGTIASSSNVFTSTQLDIYALYATSSFATSSFNSSGDTYVAYLFAHDAGGFGTAGTDNVISCGSYTGNGSASNLITLGYEPQWVLLKRTDITGDWGILDNMRGWSYDTENVLKPNSSSAEDTGNTEGNPTATGFDVGNGNYNVNTRTYIYIAIRRPMKPPTTGTEVFSPVAFSGNNSGGRNITGLNATDAALLYNRSAVGGGGFIDRLRGGANFINTSSTGAEFNGGSTWPSVTGTQNGVTYGGAALNESGETYVDYFFKRASTFFDEVCYTGTGSAGQTVNHNLTVTPELVILKARVDDAGQSSGYWGVIAVNETASRQGLYLNESTSAGFLTSKVGASFSCSATSFNAPSYYVTSTKTYVAYLFATVAGVSKVGSYTGTGTVTQTINAGFGASGARWVLIKRTDASGGWYVFDTARGFTSSSSPYLLLNSTAAEVTGNNGCYADSTGFTLTTNASTTVNVNGGSYIYLAIA